MNHLTSGRRADAIGVSFGHKRWNNHSGARALREQKSRQDLSVRFCLSVTTELVEGAVPTQKLFEDRIQVNDWPTTMERREETPRMVSGRERQSAGDDKLLTIGELADRLQYSTDWIREQVRAGRIPVIRFNSRAWRFHWPTVLAALQKLA
jgi:excisionase family DNA binding protein